MRSDHQCAAEETPANETRALPPQHRKNAVGLQRHYSICQAFTVATLASQGD
jgi:hypothetical protein